MRNLIILSLLTTACATKHPGSYEVGSATGGAAADATLTGAEALWDQRGEKGQLQAALGLYEQALAADPTNREIAARLTRGWYFLGDAHETEMPAKLAAWETAIAKGTSCIAINTEFTALLEKGDEDEESAVRVATKDDVPCLYWTATALGKWAKASGLGKILKHIGTVKAYITRVEELDPMYFHSGPARYWGAYYAAIPSFAGRDLERSKVEFDKSLEMAPGYLATRVLYAEYWAKNTENRAVFEEQLKAALAADPNAAADVAAENVAAQRHAQVLLDSIDEHFVQ